MQKKLIVSGCSITHGAETVDGFMHPENIKHSYSFHLSQWLGLDLANLALSGGSNDYIFHSLMEEIDKNDAAQIHSVFVAWTGLHRLHWQNKGRHWFFLPGWASSMENLYDWNFHKHPTSQAHITGDNEPILTKLYDQHRFFTDNYLDDSDYLQKKLCNFKSSLQSHCDSKGIRLIQIDIMGFWKESPRHPTALEHMDLARKFYEKFYA